MIICVDLSQHTKKTLDALIESGQYSDYGEVITVAIANLAVLERNVRSQGALLLDSTLEDGPSAMMVTEGDGPYESASIEVSQLFAKPPTVERQLYAAPLPPTPWSSGDPVPLERWFFGQYNRVLPVKASCRGLANMLLEKPEGVTVDEASTAIVSAASQLGKSLRMFERSLELHRDNALSTAFPSAGKKAEKSRLRFGNQFIAGTTKENNLTGFLADLSLLNYTSSARDRVALTDPGWWFAMAGNPVLDGTQEGPTQKFTDEERHILLSHIQDSVPREDSAFRSVLTAVDSGVTTPNEMDEDFVRLVSDAPVSAAFVSTQRSGAVARMVDLGLLVRLREGVHVEYVLTEDGTDYLSGKSIQTRNDK